MFTARACTRRLVAALALTLAAFVPPAEATIDAGARPVVARYLEAIGGRDVLTTTSMRVRSNLTAFGLAGTSTVWTREPDSRATEIHLGPITILDGFDGKIAWRTDPNGKLVILDGKDLEDSRGGAWFQNDRWLRDDQGGGQVALVGTQTDSAGKFTVLEVTPPIGRPRRLYFDPKTGLISRVTMRRDRQLVVSTLSDYRATAGRRMAFRELTQIEGMPANDLVILTDSVWVNEGMDDARFQPPSEGGETVKWLATPGRAVIPFRYEGKHVWVRVAVNGGEPADFLYDTGASITVIDSVYAEKIGLTTEGRLQGQGAGAGGSASFSQLRSTRLLGEGGDGIEIENQKVAVLSINAFLAPYFWRDCAGVVGFDFITRFVNEIDYDRSVLTLHDPKTWKYEGKGAVLPFTLAGTVPAVHMKIDGRYEGEFRVDVGSSSTVDLHAPFVREHGVDRGAKRLIEAAGGGFGGTFRTRLGRLQRIDLGPYSWERPIVSFSSAETGAFASEDYAGNLGNQILHRFRCILDYEHRRLYLEPGARYAEEDRFSRAGVLLARSRGVVEAAQVLASSPAAKAGVQVGDAILAIDGKPVSEWTPDRVSELFERGEVGRKVALQVERGGSKKKLTMRLAKIL